MTPYYEQDGIAIYHGDCHEVLASGDVKADHLVTDPPYNVSGEHSDEKRKDGSLRRLNFSWDGLTNADLTLRLGLAIDCLLRPSNVVAFCGHTQAAAIDQLLVARGMSTKPVAWVKECPPPSFGTTRWASAFEMGVFGFDPGATWNYRQSGMRPNVVTADALRHGNSEKVGHQTQKPIAVMSWAMTPITKPGQTILDCYCGSGTTLVVARMLGCKAIGIEREEQWCEAAAKRLAQGVLFGTGGAA